MNRTLHTLPRASVLIGALLAFACSSESSAPKSNAPVAPATTAPPQAQPTTELPKPTIPIGLDLDAGKPLESDAGDAGQPVRCGAIRIASFGKVGTFGAAEGNTKDDTRVFIDWLNTNSTAKVDLIETKPAITKEFLSQYNVILFQDQVNADGSVWWYSADEVAAMDDWIQTQGGGIISLSGFSASTAEVNGVNSVLAFAGISYNKDDIMGESDLEQNAYCNGGSVPTRGWNASHPISANITAVGSFHGHSIAVTDPAAVVVASGTRGNYGVAKEQGQGRIFVWNDEWVTYTSQWKGSPRADFSDPYNPCYQKTANLIFQTGQFWYNIIKWVSQCQDFKIEDPEVVIIY